MGARHPGLDEASVWNEHARRWRQLGSPLRPAPEDAEIVFSAFRDRGLAGAADVAVMGVTPEYAGLDWPEGTRVIGLDRSMTMIRAIWPCHGQRERFVTCSDWTRLPLADGSLDFVAGDGCFSVLPFPDGYAALAAELRRVLRPGGRFAIRCYASPETRDTPEEIHRGLLAGGYESFDEYRLRLLMALEDDPRKGLYMRDAYEESLRVLDEAMAVAEARGWPLERVPPIATWKGSEEFLTFPTLDQTLEAVAGSLVEKGRRVPAYAFGDRSPFLVLERA